MTGHVCRFLQTEGKVVTMTNWSEPSGVFATTWTKAATLSARVESEENAEERAKRIALELSATTRKRRRSKRTSSMSSRKKKSRKEKREEEEKKFDETPR